MKNSENVKIIQMHSPEIPKKSKSNNKNAKKVQRLDLQNS